MGKNNDPGVLKLHGREYHTVAKRVRDFRAAHPISDGWGLLTSIVHADAETVLFRACITDPTGREVAVGFAEEKRTNRGVNSTSALENAETSAIGRALAAAGLGGDGEYASADELANAIGQQNAPRAREQSRPGQPAPVEGSMMWLRATLANLGVLRRDADKFCTSKRWGVPSSWDDDARAAFIEDMKAGKHPDLYQPEQAGGEG